MSGAADMALPCQLWNFPSLAKEALFQTGWFVESLSTQVLVIFIIRTRGNPFKSRAHPILVATSLAVAVIGAVLPFTPLGTYFGFVPPPAQFYVCVFHANWTAVPRQIGRWFHGKVDSRSDATRGVGIVYSRVDSSVKVG